MVNSILSSIHKIECGNLNLIQLVKIIPDRFDIVYPQACLDAQNSVDMVDM